MLRLHLVRHGHTIWHDSGGVAGRTDIDLSQAGRQAVMALASSWPAQRVHDCWHSSPLKRTRETTDILREYMATDGDSDVRIDERLVELDFGDWEGMTWQSVHENHAQEMDAWGRDWEHRSPPNGETFAHQAARCDDWLQELVSREQAQQTHIVVLHGGSIRALVCCCLGWPLTQAMSFSVDPATVTTLDLNRPSGRWVVRAINAIQF